MPAGLADAHPSRWMTVTQRLPRLLTSGCLCTHEPAHAFGPLPTALPRLAINSEPLRLMESATYIGTVLTSSQRCIFVGHRTQQAVKRANCTWRALTLTSRELPLHLTLDLTATGLDDLECVQHTYAHRVFGLPTHAPVLVPLLDLGLWPLRYRHVLVALQYLRYLVTTATTVPRAALRCALVLTQHGHPSWFSDLAHALLVPPVPVVLDHQAPPNTALAASLISAVQSSLQRHVVLSIQRSQKLSLWQLGLLPTLHTLSSLSLPTLLEQHAYCAIPCYAHRCAIARLLAGIPPLYAIEVLHALHIPCVRRICRFCCIPSALEDEEHILFVCPDRELQAARNASHSALLAQQPPPSFTRQTMSQWHLLPHASSMMTWLRKRPCSWKPPSLGAWLACPWR
ncbi:hypothetical protein BN946_scf185015.g19 [Trametes cinnabarina]|uniref:Reverse transcriptase zinc-binding domain-containing protein n=1 Tax=Pycnoporus cinnabarinus TaxID=5643 RepID=A0A060SHM2_PYCCI|nr:hypothetical protein BN946_scf185015.g19 [Trametes cinnabarina]